MTVSTIGQFRYPHVDDTDATMGIDFDFEVFPEDPMDETEDTHDAEYQTGGDDEEQLWWPLTAEEPDLDATILDNLEPLRIALKFRGFKLWMFW